MPRHLTCEVERYPIAGAFTISRGSKTEAEVVVCTIADGAFAGRGECVPYRRYGESIEGVRAEILAAQAEVRNGVEREELLRVMKPGAARNAVDCALWDLEAKRSGTRAHVLAGIPAPGPVTTAMTISLGEPEAMAASARANAARPLLKVKVGTDGDIERIRAVAKAAPRSRIILDANEGWTEKNLVRNLEAAAAMGIALIEQPLPEGRDAALRDIARPVLICADESVHTAEDLEKLVGLYDMVNIKLDKTGGLTAALKLRDRARELGFGVLVGCMVGTSLGMAPAVLLAQGADFIDLDGPLLLARDRDPGLAYAGSLISPPGPDLWG